MVESKRIEPAHPLFRLVFGRAFNEDEKSALNIGASKGWPKDNLLQAVLEASVINLWDEISLKITRTRAGAKLDFDAILLTAARVGNTTAMGEAHRCGATYFSSALGVAAGKGHIAAMRKALAMGTSERCRLDFDIALSEAAEGGHIAAMREARAMGATHFDWGLSAAAKTGQILAMREARDMGATDFVEALEVAALRGQMAAVKEALAMGAVIGNEDALINAAEKGHIGIMRELSAAAKATGFVLNFGSILCSAAIGGSVDAMREALAMGQDAKQSLDLDEALADAADFGEIATVKEAIAMGATDIARALYLASRPREARFARTYSREVIDFLQARL
jgi:hypothetical protein